MSGAKPVPGPGFPLHAWGIEVDGSVHAILFACEPHSLGCAARSAEQIAELAQGHDGQHLVRLRQLDFVAELAGRPSCFGCRLDNVANARLSAKERQSTSTPARALSIKEN